MSMRVFLIDVEWFQPMPIVLQAGKERNKSFCCLVCGHTAQQRRPTLDWMASDRWHAVWELGNGRAFQVSIEPPRAKLDHGGGATIYNRHPSSEFPFPCLSFTAARTVLLKYYSSLFKSVRWETQDLGINGFMELVEFI